MSAPTPFTRPDAALLALRPAITGQPAAIPTPATVADFQQQVLRPLLKLQQPVLLAAVADVALDYRLPLATANATEASRLLGELLARHTRLRAGIIGLVTGQLTLAELAFYRRHRNELNRRLLDLAQQRVLSSVPELLRCLSE
ncbi:hypothetical protein [Hymenobacter sp. BRD67]|uniref:hypothetical protein n=1 Tax=Hymenobacter sp. BRD67 TaxID=2675877 RepID=UPI001563BB5C|nr:hypothetical protein [Hymenobacter sp. BRD67]QKG54316.1 hypothetical protein GKZ67_19075 [Hymenobacter sp. BRD67]